MDKPFWLTVEKGIAGIVIYKFLDEKNRDCRFTVDIETGDCAFNERHISIFNLIKITDYHRHTHCGHCGASYDTEKDHCIKCDYINQKSQENKNGYV